MSKKYVYLVYRLKHKPLQRHKTPAKASAKKSSETSKKPTKTMQKIYKCCKKYNTQITGVKTQKTQKNYAKTFTKTQNALQ